ncbi:MAG: tetratricopeptide repeat protein [Dysgonomonas sp.]
MVRNKIIFGSFVCFSLVLSSCSNQKNTKQTRLYHEINTRYNIYYNAEIAYNEALESKNKSYTDNLSQTIYVYPYYPAEENQKISGFETTIDKATKAIKLHSIQVKPERDPSKRRDIKYQEWLQQKEFNPFLKNVWLLMAKAEYQSLDYVRAISTFSYITRLFKTDPEVVAEANLWIAKAYTQMGWVYEADNIFHKIKLSGGVPDKLKDEFSEVYADYLVRNKQYSEAIPYLQQAINNAGGLQKIRLRYLLGQLYGETGEKNAAYKAFEDVQGLSTPYLYTLNSKIQQVNYIEPHDTQLKKKTLSSLKGMTGSSKNEEYLDQIYYSIGNIYMMDNDTAKTIENYKLAIEKSSRSGYDKGIVLVSLGDIYFQQRDFIKAQPLYPEALGILGKKYDRYKELSLRSEVLDELVVYAEAVYLQDSLQTLAKMPEDQRLEAINKIIEDVRKKEKEEQQKQAEADWKEQNPDEKPNMVNVPSNPKFGATKRTFYFYNAQTVNQGKATFKSRWGSRKLEDNWRRKDKTSTTFGGFDDLDPQAGNDTIPYVTETDLPPTEEEEKANDKYSPEYYLKQLPLTGAAMQESNNIIEDAYYNMGMIYKNKLEDLLLAIEGFDKLLNRFPNSKSKEEVYYQLFLIYSQLGNKNMAEIYRVKLMNEFPQGDYAITLSDPNYEWNLRNLERLENELYDNTYDAYLASNVNLVRTNYSTVQDKYPLSKLAPKFMFLDALTYAQTNEPKDFRDKLKGLIEKYPDAEVTPLASEMLKGLLSGRTLGSGGPMRGMIWNIQFAGEDLANIDTTLVFVDKPENKYRVLLVFDPKKIDRNELIYNVADYNFSRFVVQTFDLSFSEIPPFEILQVQGLESFRNVVEYTNKAFQDSSLIEKLDPSIIMVPISDENYTTLMRGKSLADYFTFFTEHYKDQMPELVSYWEKQMNPEEKEETVKEKETPTEQVKEEKKEQEVPIKTQDKKDTEKIPVLPEKEEKEKTDEQQPKTDEGLETIISDEDVNKAVNTVKDINTTINEVMDNPVDGIKNIIENIKNKPKLTKEEKETLKEEQKRQKEIEKEKKQREKEVQDSIRDAEKARQDSIKQAEKEAREMEKEAERAKEDARKAAIQAKEDARKQREQELKDKEKAQKERMKQREQERKERLKQREQEQKEKLEQREKEREAKRKQREQELKEKERQAKERRNR